MKLFSLILSFVVFFVSLYFFILELPVSNCLDDIIYISLLVILMAICVVGVITNWRLVRDRNKNPMVLFIVNGFSKKKK